MLRVIPSLLGRLNVGRKLLLICLLNFSVVLVIGGLLARDKLAAVGVVRKEVKGVLCLAEVGKALQAVAAIGPGASPRQVAAMLVMKPQCRNSGGLLDNLEASRAFDQALERLGDLDMRRQEPQALAELVSLRENALRKGRALAMHVGSQAGLTLDDGVDVALSMSIVTARLPELLDVANRINSVVQGSNGPTAQPDWRGRFQLIEGRFAAVAQLLDAESQQVMAGARDTKLGTLLGPAVTHLLGAIEGLNQGARVLAEVAPGTAPAATQLQALQDKQQVLRTRVDEAWLRLSEQVQLLLEQRVDALHRRMALELGAVGALVVVVWLVVLVLSTQITMPLHRLADVMRLVRRTGDYSSHRASWDARDELGALVQAFNKMLSRLSRQKEEQAALLEAKHAAQARAQLVESAPLPFLVTALPAHEVLHANAAGLAWIAGAVNDPWSVGLEPAVRTRFLKQLAEHGQLDEFEVCWRAGVQPTWAVLSSRRLAFQGRDAVLTVLTPVKALKQTEQRSTLWAKVFESASEAIAIVDHARHVVSVNPALCQQTACEIDAVVGRGIEKLLAEESGDGLLDRLWRSVETQGRWQGEVRLRQRDGGTRPAWLVVNPVTDGDAAAQRTHYIFSLLDISERKAHEERLHHLANHDPLTGLPNRAVFIERLRGTMQQARQTDRQVAVLYIDLDRFQTINDSMGHHTGDALLRSVAQRLQEAVRGDDQVCRLSGDKFAVSLAGVRDMEEVRHLVEHRFIPLVRREHNVGGSSPLQISCSAGVALYPANAHSLEELMRFADVAMNQAKEQGRDAACFFTPELNERAHRRLMLEAQLRQALEYGEFVLHYQPRVAAQGGELVAVEALLRWHSDRLGQVSPSELVPVAEEANLIVPIGNWVIDQACRQQAQWKKQGLGEIAVSVNVSALQLRDGSLAKTLQMALERHGVRPASLELELTESTLMEDVDDTLQQLETFKRIGVQLAIDDFGTGYSSLNYLHRFPVDRIKIDRSFMVNLLQEPSHLAITNSIVELGHTMGLHVVAEGVEDEETAKALRNANCDELQGYLFARPLPPAELAAWIRQPPPQETATTRQKARAKPKLRTVVSNSRN